jgi:hypothetical protein
MERGGGVGIRSTCRPPGECNGLSDYEQAERQARSGFGADDLDAQQSARGASSGESRATDHRSDDQSP